MVTGEECLAKRKRFVLIGQWDLAHGRRLNRLAAVVADQLGHLGRPTAFEADHAQPAQPLQHCLPRTASMTSTGDDEPRRTHRTVSPRVS